MKGKTLVTLAAAAAMGLVIWAAPMADAQQGGPASVRQAASAGGRAMQLWDQRDRQRARDEYTQRYWDYYYGPRDRPNYSNRRMWYDLWENQRWLQDPGSYRRRVPPDDRNMPRLIPVPVPMYPPPPPPQ